MKRQNYIDLHCHPSFKSNFKNPGKRWNNWDGLQLSDVRNSSILVSQSSLSQILQSSNLVVVPLHPVEPGMIDNYLIRIGDLILNAVDTDRLNSIINNNPSSFDLIRSELINLQERSSKGQKVKIIKRFDEYDESDLQTLHVVLAVEGPHSFYLDENKVDRVDEILKRFTDWIEQTGGILYQSLTHLTYGIFANHAYGNKILPKKKMLPEGFGIRQPWCQKLIDEIYGHQIIVDVKHMSLVAREQFYKYHNENWSLQPIICSHCAVTGFSWDKILEVIANRPVKLEKIELWNNTVKIIYKYFFDPIRNVPYYPLSINLYDEDIMQIIQSNGLICLEMDARMLGEKVRHPSKEFVTRHEFNYWTEHHPATNEFADLHFIQKVDQDYMVTIDDADEELENNKILFGEKPEYIKRQEEERVNSGCYEKLFVNQLLHIHEVVSSSGMKDINAWNYISIGSDFDGLIESLPICVDATQMDEFAEKVQIELDKNVETYSLDLGDPTSLIIEKIFRMNALNLIKSRL